MKAYVTSMVLVIALALTALPAISGDSRSDEKNWRRIQWVDEKGVVHTSLISPRKTEPSGAPQPNTREIPPMPEVISTKVVKVLSPDTIVLEGNRKLHYVGLQAPAQNDPDYEQALSFHKKLVEGKYVNVLFDSSPKAPDGELLGFVFINQLTFVNADLIRFGHARANPQAPNVKYQILFDNLEKRAQTRKLGIWKK